MGSDRRQAVLLDSFAGELENVVRPSKASFLYFHIPSNIAGSYIYDLPVVNGGHAHLHRLVFLSGFFNCPHWRKSKVGVNWACNEPRVYCSHFVISHEKKRDFVTRVAWCSAGVEPGLAIQLWGVMYIGFSQLSPIMSGNINSFKKKI
jgi:hypothetical protein